MELAAEAGKWYKMYSTQITALLAALAFVQANWAVFSTIVPDAWMPWIVFILATAAFVGRLIKQTGIAPATTDEPADLQ